MQAYSVKYHAKKERKDAKSTTMKNGKPATQCTQSIIQPNINIRDQNRKRPTNNSVSSYEQAWYCLTSIRFFPYCYWVMVSW
jgi:hypothetical protein